MSLSLNLWNTFCKALSMNSLSLKKISVSVLILIFSSFSYGDIENGALMHIIETNTTLSEIDRMVSFATAIGTNIQERKSLEAMRDSEGADKAYIEEKLLYLSEEFYALLNNFEGSTPIYLQRALELNNYRELLVLIDRLSHSDKSIRTVKEIIYKMIKEIGVSKPLVYDAIGLNSLGQQTTHDMLKEILDISKRVTYEAIPGYFVIRGLVIIDVSKVVKEDRAMLSVIAEEGQAVDKNGILYDFSEAVVILKDSSNSHLNSNSAIVDFSLKLVCEKLL